MCAWTARSIFIHLRVAARKNNSKNRVFGSLRILPENNKERITTIVRSNHISSTTNKERDYWAKCFARATRSKYFRTSLKPRFLGSLRKSRKKTQDISILRKAHNVSDDNHSRLALREATTRSIFIHLRVAARKNSSKNRFSVLYTSCQEKFETSSVLRRISGGFLSAQKPLAVHSYSIGFLREKITRKSKV